MQLPSITKIMHAVGSHITEQCDGKQSTHLHTLELDCEFQKLQLTSKYLESPENHALVEIIIPSKKVSHYYEFLSAYQSLHFSLRGPPINS